MMKVLRAVKSSTFSSHLHSTIKSHTSACQFARRHSAQVESAQALSLAADKMFCCFLKEPCPYLGNHFPFLCCHSDLIRGQGRIIFFFSWKALTLESKGQHCTALHDAREIQPGVCACIDCNKDCCGWGFSPTVEVHVLILHLWKALLWSDLWYCFLWPVMEPDSYGVRSIIGWHQWTYRVKESPSQYKSSPRPGVSMYLWILPLQKEKKLWTSHHFPGQFSFEMVASLLFFEWPFDQDADML